MKDNGEKFFLFAWFSAFFGILGVGAIIALVSIATSIGILVALILGIIWLFQNIQF